MPGKETRPAGEYCSGFVLNTTSVPSLTKSVFREFTIPTQEIKLDFLDLEITKEQEKKRKMESYDSLKNNNYYFFFFFSG